jgi:hypothetical protein
MEGRFTVGEARALIPALRRHVTDLTLVRADLAEAQLALQRREQHRPHAPAGLAAVGGLAEVKALEARLQEAVDWFGERGIHMKGIAPKRRVVAAGPLQ